MVQLDQPVSRALCASHTSEDTAISWWQLVHCLGCLLQARLHGRHFEEDHLLLSPSSLVGCIRLHLRGASRGTRTKLGRQRLSVACFCYCQCLHPSEPTASPEWDLACNRIRAAVLL